MRYGIKGQSRDDIFAVGRQHEVDGDKRNHLDFGAVRSISADVRSANIIRSRRRFEPCGSGLVKSTIVLAVERSSHVIRNF